MSKGDKLYHNYMCAAVLNNPSTSQFSRDIIQAALKRDPVDVANELEFLASLFRDRADRTVAKEILLEEGLLGSGSRLEAIDDK